MILEHAGFLDQLARLLLNYVQQASVFFAVHLLLLLWLAHDVFHGRLRREIAALRVWRPGRPGITEATRVLAQFARSTQKWGRHGVLVPMTDFSDRLDSVADSTIEELHGRVNLFLIVGIAGTFFGLFEFAAEAKKLLISSKTGDLSQFAGIFSEALAKAFPVGFVGLCLMIAGHIVVSRREQSLRNAMAGAVQRAMDAREEAFASPVEAITEAMRPLQGLQEALTNSLTPVVEELGKQLKDSAGIVQTQFKTLEEAVSAIQVSVASLHVLAESLKGLLEGAPKVIAGLQQVVEESGQQVQGLAADVNQAAGSLRSASGELSGAAASLGRVPESVLRETAASLSKLIEASGKVWADSSEGFFRGFQDSLLTLMLTVRDTSAEACAKLTAAAGELQGLANQIQATVVATARGAIEGTLQEARTVFHEVDEALRDKYPQAIASLKETAVASTELLKGTQEAAKTASSVPALVEAVAGSLRCVNAQLSEYIEQLRALPAGTDGELKEAIDAATAKVAGVASEVPKTVTALTQLNAVAREVNGAMGRIITELRRRPRRTWDWVLYGGRKPE